LREDSITIGNLVSQYKSINNGRTKEKIKEKIKQEIIENESNYVHIWL
jgi:hypothetical protein